MARRLILDASGLRVSRPSVDVATAGAADLLFDSGGSPYNGFHMSGRLAAKAFAETSRGVAGGGVLYTRTASAVFGKTFPTNPRVFVGVLDPNNGGLFTPNLTISSVTQGSVSGKTTGAALTMSYAVSPTQLDVTISYLFYSGSGLDRSVDVAYTVFAA